MLRFLQEYLAKCLPSNWHCLINTPCDPFFNWKRQIQTEKKTGIKNSVCYIDLQVLIFFWKYLCPIVTNLCKFYEEVIHEGMGRGRRGRVCASSNTFNIPFSCDSQIYLKKLMHCSIKMLLLILFLHDSHYLLNLGLSFHFSRVPPPILSLLYLSFSNLCSPSMKRISWLVTIYYWIQYNLQIIVFLTRAKDDREEKTVTADKTARAAT